MPRRSLGPAVRSENQRRPSTISIFAPARSRDGSHIRSGRPLDRSLLPQAAARNRLVSLALRPAPVTLHWRQEGPYLTELDQATQDITWLEAPNQRVEAKAIALRLRQAAELGQTAAVITPDRNLTRRIATALAAWNITPDDSAGIPLSSHRARAVLVACVGSGAAATHLRDPIGLVETSRSPILVQTAANICATPASSSFICAATVRPS